ncbi:hypothetical protein SAMN05421831_10141 [Allopseudospirillum japonicum]|uniref:Exonuclease n=1 Tax=Allopseudospirillum japonicum TaxID=64971 RepID=A0A1H6Q9D5_9GAMM|nr:hypothetical protein [Allopseudospirillum japonicum]SEI37434.1 hypothetical protein SAMN05421831_10141 [Allopseudospirillum japonicum]
MEYPHFIALDMLTQDEDTYPIGIAWSLTDGQIKSTLIAPDDLWQAWPSSVAQDLGYSRDQLLIHGVPCAEVIRELDYDVHTDQLWVGTELSMQAHGLHQIYMSCQVECPWHLEEASQLYPEYTEAELLDELQHLAELQQLDLRYAEAQVQAWLHLHAHLHRQTWDA